ncbi:hypothetical protein TEPIDINF_000078 [Tepidibacillus infernus]|uniref:Uncharacterized protein n=2 Tax=Tepidibacillus TaxID=1494427 RepID=A0A135L1A8_9BACI|nr:MULTISPECIES: hypothetical protein [Tepidibacillus]KXG42801.1 hypothetical protein U473_01205 [Tepidibacillus decaturensis]
MVVGLGFLIIIISYRQVKNLLVKKQKRDAYVYLGLMAIAAYLSIGKMLDLYIPNPTNGLRLIFQPIKHWIDKLLS